jgi:outer membrane receptor for ferrienterochelin and colicin
MATCRMDRWTRWLAVFCFFLPFSAGAEPAEDQTAVLEQMVVTATKTKRDISNTAASISVIQAEDIDLAPTMTLDEAFRFTPSVQIFRGEGVATVHNFTSIRGIGDSRNLLYVDGVDMVESMSGNTNLSFLPTEGVERVEILRGPSSALYGGRGMSGVINIMTKNPEPGFHGSFKPLFGNYDYQKYIGSASYGGGKFSVSLNLSDIQTDNYWARDTIIRRDYNYRTGVYTYDYDSDYETEGHEGWENWNRDYKEKALRSKLRFAPNDSMEMTLVVGTMDNETGNGYTDRYTDASGNDVEKYLKKEKTYVGLTGDVTLPGNAKVAYRLTYHKPEYRNTGENMDLSLSLDDPALLARGGRAPQFYRSESIQGSKDYDAEVKYSVPLSPKALGNHMVTVGAEYMRNDIYWSIEEKETGRPLTTKVDTTKDAWSVYLQDEFAINEKFTLTAGVRGDFYDDFDDEYSPQVSLLYRYDPTAQFFISGGYAYNPPAYSDKYGTDWNMTSYTIRTNNPDLDAEKLKSLEMGVRKSFAGKFHCSLTAYYSEADDLIESIKEKRQIGGADSSVFMTYEYHDNIDKATMKGIESEFTYDVTPNHRFSGGLTYMDARNDETDQRLERTPHLLGYVSYRYNRRFDRFRIWTTIRGRGQDSFYIGEYSVEEPRKVCGFFVCDLSIGVDIGKHVSLFTDLTNLFDSDYREFTYTRYQPGRVWMAGCEIRF